MVSGFKYAYRIEHKNRLGCIEHVAATGYMKRLVRAAEVVWTLQYRYDVAKYTNVVHSCITTCTHLMYDTGTTDLIYDTRGEGLIV